MDIQTNISLKNHLTMRLGGSARFLAVASSAQEIVELCKNAREQQLRIFILGSGSNSLVNDGGFDGIVIQNTIKGVTVLSETPTEVIMRYGAGELWDDAVKLSVEKGLTGIEAMSAIPGTMGAAPVQNIGAYGQELSDTFVELEAYDIEAEQFVTLSATDCQFSYRHSIFRGEMANRYVITSVTLKLFTAAPQPPFYKAVEDYFTQNSMTNYSVAAIRSAVMAIRRDKLPDPAERPNSGSFFKNAIVEKWQLEDLRQSYPDIPSYDLGNDKFKVPTGWLIEQVGFKGQLLHGMRVNDKNALVLINESAASFDDLDQARTEIINKVRDTFRITIEQEPLEL